MPSILVMLVIGSTANFVEPFCGPGSSTVASCAPTAIRCFSSVSPTQNHAYYPKKLGIAPRTLLTVIAQRHMPQLNLSQIRYPQSHIPSEVNRHAKLGGGSIPAFQHL